MLYGGYPYVPAFAIAGMVILLVATLINSFVPTMIGIFVLLIGNGFFDVFMDKRHLVTTDTPTVQVTRTTKRTTKK